MKTAKSTPAQLPAKTGSPFFSKESGQGFFSATGADKFFTKSVMPIQTKLSIGAPNDIYEKEADAMAGQVVQRLSDSNIVQRKAINPIGSVTPFIQAKCATCEKEDRLQKKSIFESRDRAIDQQKNTVQRKCAHCEKEESLQKKEQAVSPGVKPVQAKTDNLFSLPTYSTAPISTLQKFSIPTMVHSAPFVQTKCAHCEQEEKLQKKEGDEEKKELPGLQKKPIFESNSRPDEEGNQVQRNCAACDQEEKLQKQEASGSPQTAGSGIENSLTASKGSGSPLPEDTRQQMESSFGHDFSGVRIHNDSSAAQMNNQLHAHAFTNGNDIYFNSGQYDTTSTGGKFLLAHELTHTIQQGHAAQLVQRDVADYIPGPVKDVAAAAGGALSRGGHAIADEAADLAHRAAGLGVSIAKGAEALAERAFNWLETQAGAALKSLVESLGGTIIITAGGIKIHIPGSQICDPHEFTPQPEEHKTNLTIPIPLLDFGPLIIAGEIGAIVALTPQFLFQVGPCFLTGVDLVINPASGDYSISGGVRVALSASVGGELRIGGRGALNLYIIIPEPPVILQVPVAGIELGGAGLIQALAATNLTFERGLAYSGGNITFSKSDTYDLGLALNAYLGAYGQLDVLNQDLCRIYWPLWEWHPNIALEYQSSNALTLGRSAGGGLMTSEVSSSSLKEIPFGDIPTALWIPGFTDSCPLKDILCKIGYAMHIMPSQNGGSWKGHPAPPFVGPLPVFPRKPPIASGSECRGACGPNCDYCHPLGIVPVCETLPGGFIRDWAYPGYEQCGSNGGCREHDAAFDWCAAGGEMSMWGPCHMLANLECNCSNEIHDCIGWAFGRPPFDSLMEFSAPPVASSPYPGTCPCTGGGGMGSSTNGDDTDRGMIQPLRKGDFPLPEIPLPGLDPRPRPPVIKPPTPIAPPQPVTPVQPQPLPQPQPGAPGIIPVIPVIPKLTPPPIPKHGKMPGPQPEFSTKPQLKPAPNACFGKGKPGAPTKPKPVPGPVPKPCPKPTDVANGVPIYFGAQPERFRVGTAKKVENTNPSFPGRWVITYKPKYISGTITLDAYDADCNKVYKVPGGHCVPNYDGDTTPIKVPARTVAGKTIGPRDKSDNPKAYPLCWDIYRRAPKPVRDNLVGLDRLKDKSAWFAGHLINGSLGGPGAPWNLAPIPSWVNEAMKNKYEIKLTNLVVAGQDTGDFYWFEATTNYFSDGDHKVIGHYSDFVTSIDVAYGKVRPDPSGTGWIFDPALESLPISSSGPTVSDIDVGRLSG
jgi:Domain of unknown function (DUF4157)